MARAYPACLLVLNLPQEHSRFFVHVNGLHSIDHAISVTSVSVTFWNLISIEKKNPKIFNVSLFFYFHTLKQK